jgi:hypothetical protein
MSTIPSLSTEQLHERAVKRIDWAGRSLLAARDDLELAGDAASDVVANEAQRLANLAKAISVPETDELQRPEQAMSDEARPAERPG